MACIGLHTTRDELAKQPAVLGIINTNSPLQFDIPMTEAVVELATAGQVSAITPFTLAGSMSPATMAGTLVQQTAEVLAVVTFAQCVNPGAPVMYGAFASNVDMRSGAPALGTPEYTKAALASGQIARHLGLPFRSSNTTVSNCVDAQAAYESPDVAVGRRHGSRKPRQSCSRLAGRWPYCLFREIDPGCRDAADDG